MIKKHVVDMTFVLTYRALKFIIKATKINKTKQHKTCISVALWKEELSWQQNLSALRWAILPVSALKYR